MSIRDNGIDLDAIRRINASAVNEDGTVKSFKEQLLEYEYGYYNAFLPFIVCADSHVIEQAGAENYPIIMNASVLAKLKQKHDLVPMEIAELPKLMGEDNVLMLDSYTFPRGGLCMYLDARGVHDEPLFVAFHLDEKSGEVSVNRLASVYERANIEFTITKTWEMGLNLYPNGKTKNWLKSLGLQLPDNLASLLTGDYRSLRLEGQAGSRTTYYTRSAGRWQDLRACLLPALRLRCRACVLRRPVRARGARRERSLPW